MNFFSGKLAAFHSRLWRKVVFLIHQSTNFAEALFPLCIPFCWAKLVFKGCKGGCTLFDWLVAPCREGVLSFLSWLKGFSLWILPVIDSTGGENICHMEGGTWSCPSTDDVSCPASGPWQGLLPLMLSLLVEILDGLNLVGCIWQSVFGGHLLEMFLLCRMCHIVSSSLDASGLQWSAK